MFKNEKKIVLLKYYLVDFLKIKIAFPVSNFNPSIAFERKKSLRIFGASSQLSFVIVLKHKIIRNFE